MSLNPKPAIGIFLDDQTIGEFTNSLEIAAFGAIFNNVEREWPLLEPQCQSADCEWPQINTLAVCYAMRNITEEIRAESRTNGSEIVPLQTNTASLMNGTALLSEEEDIFLGAYAGAVNITAIEPDFLLITEGEAEHAFPFPRNTIAFKDEQDMLDTTFSQLLMVYNNLNTDFEDPSTRYRAVEILMHFCVRTLDVEVKQGESSTKSINTHTKISEIKGSTFSVNGPGETGYMELSSADEEEHFRLIESADLGQLDEDLGRAFAGYFTGRSRENVQPGEMTRQIGMNMFRGVEPDTPTREADERVLRNLEGIVDTIATSMTN